MSSIMVSEGPVSVRCQLYWPHRVRLCYRDKALVQVGEGGD